MAQSPIRDVAQKLSLATSYQDERGFISQEERTRRMIVAATHGGLFRVVWGVRHRSRIVHDTRSLPVAVYLVIRLIEEGERPLLYAATYNSDALISARSYRDEERGKWVSRNEALADVLQEALDTWAQERKIKNVPAPILNRLRPKRRIKRERL